MFHLKRKGREQSAKLHDSLKTVLAPVLDKFYSKIRYQGRTRLINRWGRKHPKKVVWFYGSFAVMILGWNIAGLFIPHNPTPQKDPLGLERMASTGGVFDGMVEINKNRESIQSNISDYANVSMKMYEQLDSLLSLENKTGEDSLRIAKMYKKLNFNSNSN